MGTEPLEHVYFGWLCSKVLDVPMRTHKDVLWILFTTEFVWLLPGDRDRCGDGVELRLDFLREAHVEDEPGFTSVPCSIFEMLLALSYRAEFQTDEGYRHWFWRFLEHLKLDEYRQVSPSDEPTIKRVLDEFIFRTYTPLGHGGLFPLSDSLYDQRKVEIWSQLFEYLWDQGVM